MKEGLSYVGFCVLVAIAYGIAHDMVTAHLAVEYFTVHHVHLVNSTSPIVMALLWGVIATWWVGMLGGSLVALSNSAGSWPGLEWAVIRRWTVVSVAILFVIAMLLLLGLYLFAGTLPPDERRPTFELDRRLAVVGMVHVFSYFAGAVAFALLCAKVVTRRWRLAVAGRVPA